LKKKWQWHALTMLRQTLPTPGIRRLVRWCFRRYPKGFIAQVQRGDVPARYHTLATYLAKYVVSPPISVRRIDRYDGHRVTYHYRSHRTERVAHETVDVHQFIGRMIQHVVPKGFKRFVHQTPHGALRDLCRQASVDVDHSRRLTGLTRRFCRCHPNPDPSLHHVQGEESTRHPGWSNGRVEDFHKLVLREDFNLSDRASLDQFSQDGSRSTADDAAVPTKPRYGDHMVRINLQLYADAIPT
jgi:hypothetical protein